MTRWLRRCGLALLLGASYALVAAETARAARRRTLLLLLTLPLLTVRRSASAERVPTIGFLTRTPARLPVEDYFRDALRELGYVEGENVRIEWRRSATGSDVPEVLPAARELVQLTPAVIVAFSTPAALAAVQATRTIPIVFTAAGDPTATGLVDSLARPGGNATGVSIVATEVMSKRLDLLHQLVPRARKVAVLVNLGNPSALEQITRLRSAAQEIGIRLEVLDARSAEQVDRALASPAWRTAEAALVGGDTIFLASGGKVAAAVKAARRPTVFPWREFHQFGVPMSYGSDLVEVMRRGAYFVDRILKGAKPSELPVEQISKMDLIIDLRVAREIGLTVPETLLYRAEQVMR